MELAQDLGSLRYLHPIHRRSKELGATSVAIFANQTIQASLILPLNGERDASSCTWHDLPW
jgi:hypothetical protein